MHYSPQNEECPMALNPFKACVAPRPIGWISTVSRDGIHNLAPFSQFQNLSYDPPMVMIAINQGGDEPDHVHRKDTVNNIEATGCFVYNAVPYDLKEQMNITASGFAPEEDEGSVHRFLERHPDCQIAEGIDSEGFIHDKEGCIRLFPHKIEGEGHFAAVITKAGEGYGGFGLTEKGIKEKDCPEYLSFVKENLKEKPQGAVLKFGEQLYLMPEGFPALKGLKVLRPGLHLGTLKKNRFEPSHALALAMQPQEAFHVAMLSSGSQEIRQYLMGQTFSWGGEKGWYLICVDGYSIGWGKLAGGIMKNHYPKGLRMVDII